MQSVKDYLFSKPEAIEDFPFGSDVSVFKIRGKMFATYSRSNSKNSLKNGSKSRLGEWNINLKCDPEEAMMLRDVFDAVIPGYHMNKAHWNTVILDGTMPAGEVERMIDNSYGLVVRGLKKLERLQLETLYTEKELYS